MPKLRTVLMTVAMDRGRGRSGRSWEGPGASISAIQARKGPQTPRHAIVFNECLQSSNAPANTSCACCDHERGWGK
jgi:biotin-(acetyl-CoA carboxylase) ligase